MKLYLILPLVLVLATACAIKPELKTVSANATDVPINSAEKASEIQTKYSN